jgi:hypothetical protein
MAGIIAAILIAPAVSESLDDVRAWTLIAAVRSKIASSCSSGVSPRRRASASTQP